MIYAASLIKCSIFERVFGTHFGPHKARSFSSPGLLQPGLTSRRGGSLIESKGSKLFQVGFVISYLLSIMVSYLEHRNDLHTTERRRP